MITQEKYISQMLLILSRFDSDIKEIEQLTDEFKNDNPDARYDTSIGFRTELDKKLEDLSFIQPYVEDVINGNAINHTVNHRKSGYDKSRTKKIRKAYSYYN